MEARPKGTYSSTAWFRGYNLIFGRALLVPVLLGLTQPLSCVADPTKMPPFREIFNADVTCFVGESKAIGFFGPWLAALYVAIAAGSAVLVCPFP